MISRRAPMGPGGDSGGREPAINVPPLLLVLVCVFAALQLVIDHGPRELATALFINLSFFPARFVASDATLDSFFFGPHWFAYGTFATYGLLHGGWLHLAVNGLWLVTFGAPVVRRLGALRFLALLVLGTVAGAAMHLLVYWGSIAPLIGASAGVSAIMGGAARFVFDPRASSMMAALRNPEGARARPLQSLRDLWSNPTVLVFSGMVIVSNLLFGAIQVPGTAEEATIAWQAHLGGFAFGFFLFPLFDRRPSLPPVHRI